MLAAMVYVASAARVFSHRLHILHMHRLLAGAAAAGSGDIDSVVEDTVCGSIRSWR